MKEEYLPVPVEVAKTIAEQYKKAAVIILANDLEYELLQTTTYGTGAGEKAWAANAGEIACRALGGKIDLSVNYEDYRLQQAKNLLRALKDLVDWVNVDLDGTSQTLHNAEEAIREAEKFIG